MRERELGCIDVLQQQIATLLEIAKRLEALSRGSDSVEQRLNLEMAHSYRQEAASYESQIRSLKSRATPSLAV